MISKTIDLNLNDLHRATELIGEFTVDKVQVKKVFVKKEVDTIYDRIEITDISIPNSVHLENPEDFLTIKSYQLGLPPLRRHVNVPVHISNLKFSIEADIKKIQNIVLGITEDKNAVQEILISFNVHQQCTRYEIDKTDHYGFKLLVRPYRAQVKVEYNPLVEAFEYKENETIRVGDLHFIAEKVFGYFYIEDFHVNFKLGEGIDREVLDIDLRNVPRKLKPETALKVPVFCQTAHLPGNPAVLFPVFGQVSVEGFQNTYPPAIISVDVLPDSTKTEMRVEITDEDILTNGSNYLLQHNVRWLGTTQKSRMTCFELFVSNLAQAGDGIIKIRDLSLNPVYNEAQIELAEGESELFEVIGPTDFDLESETQAFSSIRLAFRHDKIIDIEGSVLKVEAPLSFEYAFSRKQESATHQIEELYFCSNCFQKEGLHIVRLSIAEDKVCPNCGNKESSFLKLGANSGYQEFEILRQSYLEGETVDFQNEFDWMPFKARISFVLEEFTGNTWLAIDFGTSASVVALADPDTLQRQTNGNIFVNMNKALLDLYDQKYHEYSFGEDRDDHIISSEILFRTSDPDKTYLKSTHYHEDVIHISPPKELLKQNSPFSVPYLKSLIGFDTIPDIKGTYQNLTYYLDREQDQPVTFAERPLSVKEVLKNVYHSFLRDFIKPQLNSLDTDKIIFSVPNTFTPKQVRIIQQIVKEDFPDFKSEYVSFISESDAVACEYIANWPEHNRERPDKEAIREQDEYIMVYDVGAGTSDLTLFKISSLSDDNKRELTILGKLGKGTAGNYLDYLIARIIDEISSVTLKMTQQEDFEPIVHFNKDFIKSFIKPNLHQPELQFFILPDGNLSSEPDVDTQEVYIGSILDHPLMEEYLVANSTEVIEQFFNLFAGTDSFISAQPGVSKLHTIIFSGRGILFERLRARFEQALQQFIVDGYEPYVIYDQDPEKLKSVVVKGALNYAVEFRNTEFTSVKVSSRNLMARYGFLYKNPKNDLWEFLEVLNPSTGALNLFPHNSFGLHIFEYDSDQKNAQGDRAKMYIDLSSTSVGYFVQSYSNDTAKDFNEKNWDYISIMHSFSKQNIANTGNVHKVPVRVQVDKENEMSVTIGREEKDYSATIKIDFSNATFKKSLWPYV